MTDVQERRLGWVVLMLCTVLFAGPLAGSSIVEAIVAAIGAIWQALSA